VSISQITSTPKPIHLWAELHDVESQALDQLKNIAALPWIHEHVAVMPDVHLGKGATVGSVIAMKGALSPSAVGVDIGCGMTARKTTLTLDDLPDDLHALRLEIEASIPVGFRSHDEVSRDVSNLRLWNFFGVLHEGVQDRMQRALQQMGTLGGGNHFIELCADEEGNIWLMLHSGSRNIGKELAERHIKIAKALEHNGGLPDPDLAVFLSGTPEMAAYRHDLTWAQEYAMLNRQTMMRAYERAVRKFFPSASFGQQISCHHNYVSEEHHFGADVLVTRKGAISAQAGEYGIIPGSMGTRSYIVKGLGNAESFTSASHGAGRRMSRSKAKKVFTVADLEAQTAGVECRKDAGVVDEIPAAYKDIDQVMENERDLVTPVATLTALLCVKG
jgi:tRNA-splicing ligase RtcB (3'-phosphate/5'-hydroxy nucleic acid ligase)